MFNVNSSKMNFTPNINDLFLYLFKDGIISKRKHNGTEQSTGI